ncbi:MAG: MBL fold metallo-hydrolase [Candidatus Saganbacteria bacterium]|nr:MBL fold metallo-hydrolase [Candidatus Saganbacteria bacterium]
MNFIKFLGTAGARVVVARQLRASGGIWLSLGGTNILIDPGPGSLVHCFKSRPKLDPATLDGLVLSHKHLDHAADINVMMEAMTVGGKERRGVVLAPGDALSGGDPVIYKYVRGYVGRIERLREKGKYRIGGVEITAALKHRHGVETYGLIFKGGGQKIAYIADSKFFPELAKRYKADIVIISVLSTVPTPFDHLSLGDAKTIIRALKPRTTLLTHFGLWMIRAKPWLVAEELSRELKTRVIAASDGMTFKVKS